MEDQPRSALVHLVTTTLATVVAIMAIEVISQFYSTPLFLPTVLLLLIVWSTSIGGFLSGFASTVLSLTYSWYYFCNPNFTFCYEASQLLQFAPLVVSMPLVLLIVTILRQRAFRKEMTTRRHMDEEVQRRIRYYDATLKASEQRLHSLLQFSREGITITNQAGEVLYESPMTASILGLSEKSIRGANAFSKIHADDLPRINQLMSELLAEPGKLLKTEARLHHPDGQWHWIAIAAMNLLNDSDIRGIIMNVRDVTEEKLYERKIRASEEKYRTLFTLAPDVVYSIDQQGRFDSLSPSFEIITDYKTDEWIGRPFLEIVHPDDRKKAIEIFQSRLAGESSSYELRILGKNGRIIPIESRSRPRTEGGEVVGSIGIARDITERKRAEENLRARTVELMVEKTHVEEERAKIVTIISAIGDAVFAVDENSRIILMNAAAEKLTGFSFAEANGKLYTDIFHFTTEDNPKGTYPDFIREVIQTGSEKNLAVRSLLVRRDGTQIPITDVAAPFRDEKGKILGAVVAFHDNTKERELERAKDEFISVASHQLRTPLGSMRWTLEMLMNNGEMTPEVKQALEQMYDNNKRMITLVNDLLNVSRIDQGRIPEKSQFIRPHEVVVATISQMQELAKKYGIEVKLAASNESVEVWFDRDRFQEIVENLISNSVKYNKPEGKVEITLEQKGDRFHLTVADTGIGIPEKEQNRVFQKFFRAANALQSDTEGSGLGLYVVKSYVEKWGGTIWFESKEGVGTQFHIDLPVKPVK